MFIMKIKIKGKWVDNYNLIVKRPKEYKLKLNPVKIGKRWVGGEKPCYVIAEIGSNFDSDIN